MKRALGILAVIAIAGLALAATGRPGSEFAMFQLINGTPRRWTLPDAGQSMLVAASGVACADLTGSGAQVVQIIPTVPMNLCVQPATGVTSGLNVWDGGCNTIDSDPNFGLPIPAYGTGKTVVLDPAATAICGAADAGAFRAVLFKLY